MSSCQKDTGSMYGCQPACSQPATYRVTVEHCGMVGTITYRSCERHAHTFAVWPDTETIERVKP